MNRNLLRAFVAATLATTAGAASAELGWSVSAGLANSDNANRVETGKVDDQRLNGTIAIIRRSSPNVAWSAVAEATKVEYDAPGSPGYDQQSLFGRLQAEGARQTIEVDLGATRVADSGDPYTNPLLRLSWNRRLNPSWTMDLNLGSEYRNTADRFVAGTGVPDSGTGAVNVSGVPAETYYGDLSFAFERPRTRFYFGGGYSRDNYVRSGELDEDIWTATVGASRRFTQRLQGFADYRYEDRDYGSSVGSDDTQTFSLRLDWGLGRATFVTLGYRREDRTSDIGTNSYTENLVYLSLSYRQGTITGPRAVNL